MDSDRTEFEPLSAWPNAATKFNKISRKTRKRLLTLLTPVDVGLSFLGWNGSEYNVHLFQTFVLGLWNQTTLHSVNRHVLQTINSDTYREKVPIAPMLTVANMMKSFHPKLVFICRVTFETTKSGIQYQERTSKTCSSTHSTAIERHSPLQDHSVLFVWGIYQQHRPKAMVLGVTIWR